MKKKIVILKNYKIKFDGLTIGDFFREITVFFTNHRLLFMKGMSVTLTITIEDKKEQDEKESRR
jgi:hypothetical protein